MVPKTSGNRLYATKGNSPIFYSLVWFGWSVTKGDEKLDIYQLTGKDPNDEEYPDKTWIVIAKTELFARKLLPGYFEVYEVISRAGDFFDQTGLIGWLDCSQDRWSTIKDDKSLQIFLNRSASFGLLSLCILDICARRHVRIQTSFRTEDTYAAFVHIEFRVPVLNSFDEPCGIIYCPKFINQNAIIGSRFRLLSSYFLAATGCLILAL